MRDQLIERFLRYVAYDTQSAPSSDTYPSTAKQLTLLHDLATELVALGLTEVEVDEYGYVMGTIPATKGCENEETIGFISHVDTSPDMTGLGVKPQIRANYDGGDIVLNDRYTLKVADFPEVASLKGHTIITTDGTTLLGADDKAGVAEIVTAAAYLVAHPEIRHGRIRIGFTPDEEVGAGVDHFNVERFGAKYAYTVDGSAQGELEFENFNAASAVITIEGRNIHPGYAKDKMVNALQVATDIHAKLPAQERPETTEGYEGFFHLTAINGTVEQATLEYIIRDHDRSKFESRKQLLQQIVESVNLPRKIAAIVIKDQYFNMREMVEPHPEIIARASAAMLAAGVTPVLRPIRGGTDGSRLSYMGLPCPNIFTGGMNFHGRFELCSVDTMERAVATIVNICKCTSCEI